MSLLLALLTFVLVVVSILMVLLILMQRAKSDGGVGAALGGGIAEATLGGEAGNVLSKATTYGAVLFFVLAFALYLGRIYQNRSAAAENVGPALPSLAPANPALPGTDTLPNPGAPAPELEGMPTPDAGAPASPPATDMPAPQGGTGTEGGAANPEPAEPAPATP